MSGSKRKPKASKNASGDSVLAIDITADKAVEAGNAKRRSGKFHR